MKRYETFEKKYGPTMEGDSVKLFETSGEDFEKIRSINTRKVWTLLDCDGRLILCAGIHFVNRMYYVTTERPWANSMECFSY